MSGRVELRNTFRRSRMNARVSRRNFDTKLQTAASTVGVVSLYGNKHAQAQTAAKDSGVQKLNYDGQPADGTQIITSLIVHTGLLYMSGQGANDAGNVQGADITSHTTKVMNNVKKLVEAGGGS